MAEDFIDIKGRSVLTAEQEEFIEKNPKGLTREGCEKEIENWKLSSNRQARTMYEMMLKKCKNFTSSGNTVDGKTILSRDSKGKITWVE